IAGGAVIDIDPPLRQRRAALAQRTAALATATIHERLAQLLRESPHGLSASELIARTGLRRDELSTQDQPRDWFVDPQWIAARRAAIETTLAAFHKRNPLLPGMPLEELRSRVLAEAPAFLLDHIARDWPALVITAETARLASHAIAFRDDEAAALDKIESAFASGGLAVPATNEVLAHCGVPPAKAKTLLQLLLRQRRLIKVSPELVYHTQAIDSLRQLLAARKGTRFTVTEFKDWTGVSRKYAIPLLEFLDRERLTRRDGDSRLIL
ncbi:MAG: SelB C-terminal domain-containing protein, partial [Acidobacteria bacterium]|nr:SelB C-terminal domain-containing protein [Acidobacteriota bacterium]